MSQRSDAPPAGGLFGLLAGLPNPQAVIEELQRLNTNLETMAPDLSLIGQGVEAMQELAVGLKNVNPEDVKKLVSSLDGATATGNKLYEKLWGKQK